VLRALVLASFVSLLVPRAAWAQSEAPFCLGAEHEPSWWPPLDRGRIAHESSELRLCEREGEPIVLDTIAPGTRVIGERWDPHARRVGLLLTPDGVHGVVRILGANGARAECADMVTPGMAETRFAPSGALVLSWSSGSDTSEAYACRPDGSSAWLSGGAFVTVSPHAAFAVRYTPAGAPLAATDTLSVVAVDTGRELVRLANARITGLRWRRGAVEIRTHGRWRRFSLPRRWP
jgi:hypothetical protein